MNIVGTSVLIYLAIGVFVTISYRGYQNKINDQILDDDDPMMYLYGFLFWLPHIVVRSIYNIGKVIGHVVLRQTNNKR